MSREQGRIVQDKRCICCHLPQLIQLLLASQQDRQELLAALDSASHVNMAKEMDTELSQSCMDFKCSLQICY